MEIKEREQANLREDINHSIKFALIDAYYQFEVLNKTRETLKKQLSIFNAEAMFTMNCDEIYKAIHNKKKLICLELAESMFAWLGFNVIVSVKNIDYRGLIDDLADYLVNVISRFKSQEECEKDRFALCFKFLRYGRRNKDLFELAFNTLNIVDVEHIISEEAMM